MRNMKFQQVKSSSQNHGVVQSEAWTFLTPNDLLPNHVNTQSQTVFISINHF